MGMFGTIPQILGKLKTKKAYRVNEGFMYLLEIPYSKDIPIVFKNIYNYILKAYARGDYEHGYMEKTEIKWVTLPALKKAVREKDPKYRKEFIQSCEIIFETLNFDV